MDPIEDDAAPSNADRIANELTLLHAMYPDAAIAYAPSSRTLTLTNAGATLVLRLPADYPSAATAAPQIASASGGGPARRDVAVRMRAAGVPTGGGEALDAYVGAFLAALAEDEEESADAAAAEKGGSPQRKTVVVHTHHLLASSKRKDVLTPADARVAGVSKPGHPGVLVFTGPREGVERHVEYLRGLRWKSFQVRLEEVEDGQEGWKLAHESGVREVGSLREVLDAIVDGVAADGKSRREVVLDVLGVRTGD